MKGYYLYAYGNDCFLVTNQQRKTDKLALKFLKLIQHKLNTFCNICDKDVCYAKNSMLSATIEEITISKGNFAGLKYLKIVGKDFVYTSNVSANPYNDVIVVQEG